MSWDATLYDDRGHVEGDWNYTHNCNRMANAVLDPEELRLAGKAWWLKHGRPDVAEEAEGTWWEMLDGSDGPRGAALLNRIISELAADPERFRAMNPPNGWGDYDSFIEILREMRDAVPEWPTEWTVSG